MGEVKNSSYEFNCKKKLTVEPAWSHNEKFIWIDHSILLCIFSQLSPVLLPYEIPERAISLLRK